MNFKKFRKYFLIALLILYVGIIVFEAIFNFNQTIISKLFTHYEDFAQPLYVLIVIVSIMTGLISGAITFSGFFIFNVFTLIILTSIGVIFGISLVFLLSRKLGHKPFEEYVNRNEGRAKKLKEIFKKDSAALAILFNFVFFLPSTFGNIILGLGDSKMTKLIIISIIGNLINQIAFILFTFGIQYDNLAYIIPSLLALILNTLIPILLYRKNIRDVFTIMFKRK
jgi:uncharacterized membrane protein YdjX (TVP38/TMEM64 family)